MVGEVVEDRGQSGEGVGIVVDDDCGYAAAEIVHGRPAEVDGADRNAGELARGVGAAHVGERVAGHHDLVDEPEHERGSRYARPDHGQECGHDARGVAERESDPSRRVQGRHALADVGPRRRHGADDGHAELDPESNRPLERLALGDADGAAVFAAFEAEPADGTPVELGDGGGDGVTALCLHRRGRRG